MALPDSASSRLVGLYVRLSALLLPIFAALAAIGLGLLSHNVVALAEERLALRVATLAEGVAGGVERMAAAGAAPPTAHLLETLLSDPAVTCALLRDTGTGRSLAAVPAGCDSDAPAGRDVVVPLRLDDAPADLLVRWSDAEIAAARAEQRRLARAILVLGVGVALLTNWIAFRFIIGRPLADLVGRLEEARREAEHSALHDSLTGLPNRRHLDRCLGDLARRPDAGAVGALQIDLDGFKAANDTLGHAAGDRVLRRVADTLRAQIRPGDFAARVGGDEFIVIPAPGTPPDRIHDLALRLVGALHMRVDCGDSVCRTGASIGLATGRIGDGRDAERLLMDADIALYRAKREGRGRVVRYEAAHRDDLEERRRMSDELQAALETGEFGVVYQPQVCTLGGEAVALEALVRWRHPRRSLLLPGDFLPVAEEDGLVARIDARVLDLVLADIARWRGEGIAPPPVSVNVSSRRLSDPALLGTLAARALPPGAIVFEVLESVLLDEMSDRLRWNIDGLQDLGIALELDDFGTGRASLASVLALRPKRIKIAGGIVAACLAPGGEKGLLGAIAAFGRELGVGLTAEGVEDAAQIPLVAAMGFDRLQGHAVSPPVPAAEVPGLLDRPLSRRA